MFKILSQIEKKIQAKYNRQNSERFECLQCGYCCENILQEKENSFGFDANGNYVISPKVSASIPHFEALLLKKRVKEKYQIDIKLIPSFVHFLKTHKVGFVSLYQLPVKNDSCIYYDKEKRICLINNAKPLSCQSFPLTSAYDISGRLTGTLDNKCKGMVDLVGELPECLFIDLKNPIFFHLKLLFASEITKTEIHGYIIHREMNAIKLLRDIFYFPLLDHVFHSEFQNFKLYDLSKLIPFGKKYFKGKRKKLLMEFEREIIDINKELIGFMETKE